MGLPRIRGNDNPETLIGTNDAEEIRGEGGNDIINGLDGSDLLRGGRGDDTIDGGAGNDRLRGDRGNDILTGGEGRDRFSFDIRGGTDRVTDYNDAEDRLDFTNFNIEPTLADSAFEILMSHAEQVGDDTVFTMDGGETIIIENTQIAVFDASDFRL
jgi:Ca2+-binding RTX toxin-like protein